MFDINIDKLELKVKKIEDSLSNSENTFNKKQYQDLSIDYNYYKKLLDTTLRIKQLKEQINCFQKELESELLDEELSILFRDEINVLNANLALKQEDLSRFIIPQEEDDSDSVIVELRAGTGGDEAALFVNDCFKMYQNFINIHSLKCELMSATETIKGGYKDIIFGVSGKNAYKYFKFESGTHRVQRVPKTETQGRIHTSAITVAVMKEAKSFDSNLILDKDIQIETQRASGAGGQHVNTTDSAVRARHIPTGIMVYCQQEKSQHKNKDKALRLLYSKVTKHYENEYRKERSEDRKKQIGTGDRSEKIRTYNYPQNRFTEHRVSIKMNLETVLDGDLMPAIQRLIETESKTLINKKLKDLTN